jgi:hypothetical protein
MPQRYLLEDPGIKDDLMVNPFLLPSINMHYFVCWSPNQEIQLQRLDKLVNLIIAI